MKRWGQYQRTAENFGLKLALVESVGESANRDDGDEVRVWIAKRTGVISRIALQHYV
jgi:hypothetical protein